MRKQKKSNTEPNKPFLQKTDSLSAGLVDGMGVLVLWIADISKGKDTSTYATRHPISFDILSN